MKNFRFSRGFVLIEVMLGVMIFSIGVLALGIGCERGCPAEEIAALAAESLDAAGLASEAVAAIVSVELKAGEPGIHALAEQLGAPGLPEGDGPRDFL